MFLGLGLYRHQLNDDEFSFAQQMSCTNLIIHLANYYSKEIVTATDTHKNYGDTEREDYIWSERYLRELQSKASEHNLVISGIENFNPADWYDVLLAGPKRDEQLDHLASIIKTVGRVGIHSFGYNFSLAGVWGHMRGPMARGGANTAYFDAAKLDLDASIPNGQVWNMTYDNNPNKGFMPSISNDELWDRLKYFLDAILPVAEQAGVELALHPDDPPMPRLRDTPRLVYEPQLYQKLLNLHESPANKLEFCMGSIQEMRDGNLYDAIRQYAKDISYVHFRNVRGKVPRYDEVFIDEGDIDMIKALELLNEVGFKGVLIPDHTPLITGTSDGWHTGMAYALGYMRAALNCIGG